MTQPKPEISKKNDITERTDPSTAGQIFSDPDHLASEQAAPKQAQADLKEAKQVMDDEGGANQAGQKQQQLTDAEKQAEYTKKESCNGG